MDVVEERFNWTWFSEGPALVLAVRVVQGRAAVVQRTCTNKACGPPPQKPIQRFSLQVTSLASEWHFSHRTVTWHRFGCCHTHELKGGRGNFGKFRIGEEGGVSMGEWKNTNWPENPPRLAGRSFVTGRSGYPVRSHGDRKYYRNAAWEKWVWELPLYWHRVRLTRRFPL